MNQRKLSARGAELSLDLTTPLETTSFIYGDANWRDKLTAVNGVGITYDAIGNPLSDGTWTYTWQNGRQLQRMQKSDVTAEFVYNADGLRVQKTVNGVVTKYILHGKNIVHMTSGTDTLHFFYDAQNRPAIVVFNGTAYAYVKNLQGDIVAILDASGNTVVSYGYDAWGAPLWRTGSMAETLGKVQPFRYRGYVYDEETRLYYLRSRYYNTQWGRFTNADITCKNKFEYCNNEPVLHCDDDGYESIAIESMAGWASSMWWITLADGPLPFGDCLYWGVIIGGCLSVASIVDITTTVDVSDEETGNVTTVYEYREHTSGARPSTKNKHQKGQTRHQRDGRGEKGDKRRPIHRGNKKNFSYVVKITDRYELVHEEPNENISSSNYALRLGSAMNNMFCLLDY